MWSHIFLLGSLPRRRPPEFIAILIFEFCREATAASVPGLLCQSSRCRPENVSVLISLMLQCWWRTGHLPLFSSHPGAFDSSTVPTPGNLSSKAKKNANARESARGLGALGAAGIDWCITVTSTSELALDKGYFDRIYGTFLIWLF